MSRCLALLPLLFSVAAPQATAQSEEQAVLAAVQKFFDTMTARDTAGAAEVLILDATYFAVSQTEAGVSVRGRTNREYVASLAQPGPRLEEQIWQPQVKIHGPIAMVWTPYRFLLDGRLSHCGVDAFSLVRTAAGWKISGVVYTVEQECGTTTDDGP